jgi:hypothetical protein
MNCMNWSNRLLYRLSAYCRCRIISGPDEQPYLERYHLLRLPFGYRIYLHRFVASDPGRGLHNHPWRHAISLLLCGTYQETRMLTAESNHALQRRQLRAGHLNFIPGGVYHRINIAAEAECWSLFLHAPKTRDWGFIRRHQPRHRINHQTCLQYRDHNEVVTQPSNPLWWKQALRPIQCPQMRLPLSDC